MFVGSLIEMMKIQDVEPVIHRNPDEPSCNAMYHLEKRGFVFDESSFKYDAKEISQLLI